MKGVGMMSGGMGGPMSGSMMGKELQSETGSHSQRITPLGKVCETI